MHQACQPPATAKSVNDFKHLQMRVHQKAAAEQPQRRSKYRRRIHLPWTLARNAHELKHLREWAGGQNSCTPQWP